MNRLATAALAVALSIGIGGCGGSPMNAHQIADKLGCKNFKVDSRELYVREGGSCDGVKGGLEIATFNDNGARDGYLTIATGFGGVYLVGDKWVVYGSNTSAVKRAQKTLGGDIH
jgi:hypothetical protein